MSRTAFSAGQVLMADTLQSVHDQGGIVVSSTTEMNLLPGTVKVCWMAGYTYRRNPNNTWVQDGADKVGGYPLAQTVTDWNEAVNTGFYKALAGTANDPADGFGSTSWMGFTIAFNPTYTHQVCWPSGIYSPNIMMQRARVNNVWGAWWRNNNYQYSWNGVDNLTFLQHMVSGKGIDGVRRFAHGMAKADPTTAASANDEWRVQCYDTNGNFTWSAIKIKENGVVEMPRNSLRLGPEAQTLGVEGQEQEPVSPEQILTVGSLMEILDKVLTPTQKTKLNNLITVGEPNGSV